MARTIELSIGRTVQPKQFESIRVDVKETFVVSSTPELRQAQERLLKLLDSTLDTAIQRYSEE